MFHLHDKFSGVRLECRSLVMVADVPTLVPAGAADTLTAFEPDTREFIAQVEHRTRHSEANVTGNDSERNTDRSSPIAASISCRPSASESQTIERGLVFRHPILQGDLHTGQQVCSGFHERTLHNSAPDDIEI